MKFSVNWLRELGNFNKSKLTNEIIIEQLTMAGLEVESLEPACVNFSGVFTAEIINVEQHPDADKLKICTVRHHDQNLTVVCGDPKVAAGFKVALATVGAKLKNGDFQIKKSKLRGVESHGMLCSLSELGLAETSDGIWVLPDNIELGLDLYQYLQLDDSIMELSLTPNRGDCFSLRGVARELSVINNQLFKDLVDVKDQYKTLPNCTLPITVLNQTACPRYVGRVIKNLNPVAITPFWMQERLRRSGIRSLYPLVDITNYVMLEYGQPMHAFDLAEISDEIIVRNADSNEKLVLLDGRELVLSSDDLLICDNVKPLALAGAMGGLHSGISSSTTNVFLESANFNTEYIARTARRHKIITDSTQRFERGVDPSITQAAITRATELLLEIAGTADTVVGEISDLCHQNLISTKKTILLREHRLKRVLGIKLNTQEIRDILTKLGLDLLACEKVGDDVHHKWQVPSHRFDINIEEDLFEELARIHGYNNIPNVLPKRSLELKSKQPNVYLAQRIRDILTGRGYLEVLTYSFIDNKYQEYFANNQTSLKLLNPISSEMSELRLSLCPGLLKVAEYNLNHKAESLRLYEIGKTFSLDKNAECIEVNKFAGILVGKNNKEHWALESSKVDFFDAKGDLELLFAELGLQGTIFINFESHEVLSGVHPGQSAKIIYNDNYIGWLAVIHPSIKKAIKIDNPVILFELNLDELVIPSYNKYKVISKFPQIRRDLAFLFKNEIKTQDFYDIVKKEAGGLLQDLFVFDIYQGEGVPEGYKSVAFAIILQHESKTLVDDEINQMVSNIIRQITDMLGGKLRE